jgi:hypothetical protein
MEREKTNHHESWSEGHGASLAYHAHGGFSGAQLQ